LNLNWLENHQVVAASLINVLVVLATASFTNWCQLQRENQRWKREKLYDLYEDAQNCFSDLLKSIGAIKDSFLEDFHRTTVSLSRLTLVCSSCDLEELKSIKSELTDLIQPNGSSGFNRPPLKDISLLNERLNKVVKNDSRLKDLFK